MGFGGLVVSRRPTPHHDPPGPHTVARPGAPRPPVFRGASKPQPPAPARPEGEPLQSAPGRLGPASSIGSRERVAEGVVSPIGRALADNRARRPTGGELVSKSRPRDDQ